MPGALAFPHTSASSRQHVGQLTMTALDVGLWIICHNFPNDLMVLLLITYFLFGQHLMDVYVSWTLFC